jgi:hypothetical protein
MSGLRKIHFTRQKVNFFEVKFKISVLWALPAHTALRVSVVNFLVFSVDSKIVQQAGWLIAAPDPQR